MYNTDFFKYFPTFAFHVISTVYPSTLRRVPKVNIATVAYAESSLGDHVHVEI